MKKNFRKICQAELLKRSLPDGGFALTETGAYRADATAWAVLALKASAGEPTLIRKAQQRLAADQEEDGRLPVQKGFHSAIWPTALCVLALNQAPGLEDPLQRSINFLLAFSGKSHPEEKAGGHDPSLVGWPWIDGTHSWAEPTALGFLALDRTTTNPHPRSDEALRLMLDRQLPKGGWNYGNTIVFNQELRPIPYSTGLVLYSLHGCVDRNQVQKSIDYITKRIEKDRTPLSLGWEIMALCAWDQIQECYMDYLYECWSHLEIYGSYNTSFLSLLLLTHAYLVGHEKPL